MKRKKTVGVELENKKIIKGDVINQEVEENPNLENETSLKTCGRGCGCPECAAAENCTGADAGMVDVINRLRMLAEEDRVMVWDPASRRCLAGPDIVNICVNGDSVQISLSKTALVTK